MKIKLNSIKTKIIMFLIPMLLIAFVVLSGLGYKFASDSLKESNLNIMSEVTKTAAGRADDQIKSEIKNLEVIASNPTISNPDISLQDKVEILKSALKSIEQVELSVSDKEGNSIDTTGSTKKIKTTQSFMKSIKGENAITNPYIDPIKNAKVISYSVPIKDSKDNIIGIITSVKDCKDFSSLNKDIKFLKTGSVIIVDSNGNFIVAEDESLVSENKNITNMTSNKGSLDELNNIGKSMIIGEQSGIGKYNYEGKIKYLAYSPIGNSGLSLGLYVDEKDLLSALESLGVVDTIVTIIMLLLLVSIISWFTIRMINRLLNAKNYVDSIAMGDFYTKIDNKYTNGTDEISEICTSVATAKSSVGSMIKAVRNNANVVKDSSVYLSKSAANLSVLTDEISAAIEEVSENTNRQSLDFKEISNKLTNFSEEVNIAQENVHLISNDVSIINNKSQIGNKDIEELIYGIINVNSSFEQFSMSIDYIQGDMKNVDEITDIINGISEQINLLALNAAIEAASAGEAGRGFNVIASEIRRLSDKSKESSQNIYKIINRLMKIINKLVEESQNMDSQLEKQKGIINKASSSFSEIAVLVNEITPKVLNIECAFENLGKNKDLILENIYKLSEEVKNTSESVESIGMSALEIAKHGEVLNTNSDVLLSKAEDLIGKVQQFKIEREDYEGQNIHNQSLIINSILETETLETQNDILKESGMVIKSQEELNKSESAREIDLILEDDLEELADTSEDDEEEWLDLKSKFDKELEIFDSELDEDDTGLVREDFGWSGTNVTELKQYIEKNESLIEEEELSNYNEADI